MPMVWVSVGGNTMYKVHCDEKKNCTLTFAGQIRSSPVTIGLAGPSVLITTQLIARITAKSCYTTHTQCWVRVGDPSIGRHTERGTHHCIIDTLITDRYSTLKLTTQ